MILALERNKNSQGSNRAGSNQNHSPSSIIHHGRTPATMRWIRINRARTWNWGSSIQTWNSNLPTLDWSVFALFVLQNRNDSSSPIAFHLFVLRTEPESKTTRVDCTNLKMESKWNELHRQVSWWKLEDSFKVEKKRSPIHMHTTLHKYSQNKKIRGSMRPPASPSESSDHPPIILDLDFKQVETNSHRSNRTGFRKRNRNTKEEGNERNPKSEKARQELMGRQRGKRTRETRFETEETKAARVEQRQTGKADQKGESLFNKWIRWRGEGVSGWDEGEWGKPTLDYWTTSWRW